jgi:HNH endonuclease
MLHRDTSARLVRTGFWMFARYHFECAQEESGRSWSVAGAKDLLRGQLGQPVLVHENESRHRRWWLFQGEYYWEDEGLAEMEVKALVLERANQSHRRLKRALALMQGIEALDGPARAPIPDEVRIFVWNRDGGRCGRCGSNERLEFDHIIPVALGGASTARNVQLLCESCNRSKGATVA